MTSITVHDTETFNAEVERLAVQAIERGYPVKVMGSYGLDDMHACLMFSHWGGEERIDSVRTAFRMGEVVFEYVYGLEQRLLNAGLLVDDQYVSGATHLITIAHGVWAHNKLPVHHKYRFRGDDVDAMLAAIKFGGRLEKI